MIRNQIPEGTPLRDFREGGCPIKKRVIAIGVAAAAFVAALILTLYPIISTIYNEKHQSQIQTKYQDQVERMDDSAIRRAKELAIAYNEAIKPGAQLAEAYGQDALLWASEDYKDQLNLTGNGIMGFVMIPALNLHLPIYHGTDSKTLEQGIGHLLGSSLPVGGDTTHTVLTAHSGMASQKMFSDLPQLKAGDIFYLDVLNETLAYKVDQIRTVLPYDTTYLEIENGQDYCTLVTCTPFAVNTHRLLVRGSRITYQEAEQAEEKAKVETQPQSVWLQEYFRSLYVGVIVVAFVDFCVLAAWLYRRYYHAHS